MKKRNFTLLDNVSDYNGLMGCGLAILLLILALGFGFGVLCLEGWAVQLLWEYVVCDIFPSLQPLRYWVAVGFVFLCNLLFKSTITITRKDD